jgi:hypothetical protein
MKEMLKEKNKIQKLNFTKSTQYKEAAIIFPIIDNVTNEQYLLALLEFIKPESIHYASGNFKRLFLHIPIDSKLSVDDFIDN